MELAQTSVICARSLAINGKKLLTARSRNLSLFDCIQNIMFSVSRHQINGLLPSTISVLKWEQRKDESALLNLFKFCFFFEAFNRDSNAAVNVCNDKFLKLMGKEFSCFQFTGV